ncbi:MAG: hypothetical protein B7X51_11790, partial [Pseudomonas sp. 34-62-33]
MLASRRYPWCSWPAHAWGCHGYRPLCHNRGWKPRHEHNNPFRLQLQGGSPVRHYDGGLGHRRHGTRRIHRCPAGLA